MKLLKLSCPSCGAKLEVNGDLEKFTCNYCGVTSLLDKEETNVNIRHNKIEDEIEEVKTLIKYSDNDELIDNKIEYLFSKYPKNKWVQKTFLLRSLDNILETNDYTSIDTNNANKDFEELKRLYSLVDKSDDYNSKEKKEIKSKMDLVEEKYNNIIKSKIDEIVLKHNEKKEIYVSTVIFIIICFILLVMFLIYS